LKSGTSAFLLPFLAIFSIPSRIRSVYRTHQVVGIFTEKKGKTGQTVRLGKTVKGAGASRFASVSPRFVHKNTPDDAVVFFYR
ncbi:hypothetical protein P4519_06945, partial [Geobacillus stearothermophilus]|uniref:hypothetical protein n=1 Tax=Geobacillus stearothermophilus TaxID=1422 RepID=UPI002E1BC9A2|nr:hypothetical protein [Geobacillus stearothermophilus]